jgi:hypothetical protein
VEFILQNNIFRKNYSGTYFITKNRSNSAQLAQFYLNGSQFLDKKSTPQGIFSKNIIFQNLP